MSPVVFRFGDCSINVASRELKRAGQHVSVPPIAFDCLVYLIRHRDRAVGRDELVAAVWGKTQVSDAAMGKTILTARRAIGDTGESQQFVRTVPRFGYRWSADVEVDDAIRESASITGSVGAAGMSVDAAAPVPARSPSTTTWILPTVVSFIAVVAIVLAIVASRHHEVAQPPAVASPPAASDLPVHVVVVLPADIDASTDDAWLRLGLMDLVATRLRDGGVAILPSDNVVRVVPVGTSHADALGHVRRITDQSTIVSLDVRRVATNWILHADLIGADGSAQGVDAQADNVIGAARALADRLLERMGKRIVAGEPDPSTLSEAELLQRIDALRLARQAKDARALIDAAPTALQRVLPVRLRRAQIDLDLGNSEVARQQFVAIADGISAEVDPLMMARVQRSLAIALSRLGQADPALRAIDRSIGLLEGHDAPDEVARTYNTRGIVHLTREEYDLASPDFARARIAANLAADSLLGAQIEGNESNMQALQGRYAEVVATQHRIGQRFRRFGMVDEYVISLIGEGSADITLLRPEEALEASSLMMAELAQVQNASTRLQAYLERANALELNGRLGEARAILDRAVQASGEASFTGERGIAHAGIARIELAERQPAAALAMATQAVEALSSPSYNTHRSGAWRTIVQSLCALGRIDEGGAQSRRFTEWAASSSDESVTLMARLAAAELAAVDGRPTDARKAYQDSLAMARRWSAPDVLREVAASYGRFLLAQGDVPQASAVIGLVASHAESDFESALVQAELYRALGQTDAAQAALAQARRLAGERPLPDPTTPVTQKSSSGNLPETRTE